MNKVNEIMGVLNKIDYGFIDNDGINIFDDNLNIEYKFNNVYHLMSPEELMKKKCGVCWDQVELERKLFTEANIPFKTYFIYIDDNNFLPSHTFLVYEENNKYYWFEHSWYDERGIHEYNDLNNLLNEVVDKHIKAHSSEIQVEFETYIYEYNKPNYNISCDDFFSFIFKQKRIYNYYLLHADLNNVDYLIMAKAYNIFNFAHDLEDDEITKINNYINNHIPNQIKNYKMIYSNNKIIGCLLVESKDDGVIIDEIYIQDEYRNKGIGSNIIKNILSKNNIVYLWVYKENLLAIKLYKSLGFNVIEETKTRYYMKFSK